MTQSGLSTALSLGLILASAPALSAPLSCVLVSRGPAEVKHGDAIRKLPLSLTDCGSTVAISGDVAVCYLDSTQKKRCRSVPAGRSVSEVIADRAADPEGSVTFAITSLLRGDAGTRAGSSRSIGQFEGLPDGKLLLPRPNLRIALLDERVKSATHFAISEDTDPKTLVVDLPVTKGEIEVSASKLKRGAHYRWQATTPKVHYSGRFTIAGTEAKADLRDARRIYGDKELSATARDALLVEFYNDRGYLFERDELLAGFLAD